MIAIEQGEAAGQRVTRALDKREIPPFQVQRIQDAVMGDAANCQ